MTPEKINRMMPHAYEAEQGILGSFARAPREVGSTLGARCFTEAHFSTPQHRAIYRAMNEFWATGKSLDVALVTQKIRDGGTPEEDLPSFLIDEIFHFPTSAAAAEYMEAVEDKFMLREIIRVCGEFGDKGYGTKDDPKTLIGSLGDAVARIAGATQRAPVKTLDEHLSDKIDRMQNDESDKQLIRTGIDRLDKESPLSLGDMPLVAGQRKAGKSILALNIAINLILDDKAVLYFSLEDRAPKVIDRLFACASRIPMANHSVKHMSEGQNLTAVATVKRLYKKRFILRDDVYDLAPMLAIARQVKTKHPDLAAIVVDYAQLVRASVSKGANREQEVAAVSRAFRLLGMELNVAMIVLVQLNKDGETRESKALEQDCTAEWKIVQCDPEVHGKRMLVIPFQRNGDSSIAFPITFLGHIARIENFVEATTETRNYHPE